MKSFFIKHRWLIFLFVFALTIRLPLLFRMDFVDFPEFYRDYYMAERVLNGPLPLYGPPSMHTNFYFGPIYYYLLAPLMLVFGGHPLSLLLTGIILYALSVIAFYKLLQLWFTDEIVSKFGALFYAISIYGIHLNSYASNPNFLPLFVILFFIFLTKILSGEQGAKNFLYLGLCYCIAAQLHLTAAVVLLSTLVISIIFQHQNLSKIDKKTKSLIFLFLGVILPAAPYLIAEAQVKFNGISGLLNFSQQTMQAKNSILGLNVFNDFFQSSLNPFYMGNSYSYIQPTWLYLLVAACVVPIIVSVVISAKNKKVSLHTPKKLISKAGTTICMGWLVAEFLLLIIFNKSAHSHYLITLWPIPALILTLLFAYAKDHLGFYKTLIFAMLFISGLQVFSFYNNPAKPWDDFYYKYEKNYKYSPQTEQIGSSAVDWSDISK